MPLRIKKRSKKTGLPPGTLIHIGEKKSERTKISILDYDEKQLREKEIETTDECAPSEDGKTVTWMNNE